MGFGVSLLTKASYDGLTVNLRAVKNSSRNVREFQ